MASDLHQALTCMAPSHDARSKAGESERRRRKPIPADRIRRAELMLEGMGRKAASKAVVAEADERGGVAAAPAVEARVEREVLHAAAARPPIDLDDDDSDSDDGGEVALALIDRGVPYDTQRGFNLAEAASAVEASALGIADADTAGDESNDATTLLIALYNDASEGLQRTTRAMAKAARASSAQAAALKLTASAANTLAAAGSVLRQR